MQLKLLQQYIEAYKKFLATDRKLGELYKYETIYHFQQCWDLDTPNFANMYAQCWKNAKTHRLWKRESWHPQEMMLKLMATDEEFVRRMFRDLFDESKEADRRISHFKFGCDEMLSDYKDKHPLTIDNNHYHDDNEMIFLYLTCRYPEQYCFFDYVPFRESLHALGVINLPDAYDVERFLKLTKVMYLYLQKDEALIELHQTRRRLPNHFDVPCKQIVHDFYSTVPQLTIHV